MLHNSTLCGSKSWTFSAFQKWHINTYHKVRNDRWVTFLAAEKKNGRIYNLERYLKNFPVLVWAAVGNF